MVTAASGRPSLAGIELGLTLITIALAFCSPRAGSGLFLKLERIFGQLARKRALSVFLVGTTAGALRLAILPLSPVPQPFLHDDFSFLLAADTFASGRLTNPTHPMWVHFETFHVTQKPTYMSMYFPAQGIVLAAGKVLAGNAWWGVWASCALMCAAICWMLQGWLPPGWALLGGLLAVLRLALFSYWINSYMGGALAALGGALVLGALPRIRRAFRARDFFWMALGMAILANSRPYEGLLVSIPALIALCWWWLERPHPTVSVLIWRIAPAATLLIATFAFMGYYNYRVFGSVSTLPYQVNRATYASAPHFLWQSARPEPVYRHQIMRDFYTGWELREFRNETRSAIGLLKGALYKVAWATEFYLNFALIPPLILFPWVFRDRRTKFLLIGGIVLAVGLGVETWFMSQYPAPFTALLFAILLQCMRHLRVSRPSGLFLVRATPMLCLVLALLCLYSRPLHIGLARDTSEGEAWYGAGRLGLEREQVLAKLESLPGPQLAIVPYSPHHVFNDWIYNEPDIDKSKVVWAREIDPDSDRELLTYFKNRTAWLVEPDRNPPKISPFRLARETKTRDDRVDLTRASLSQRAPER